MAQGSPRGRGLPDREGVRLPRAGRLRRLGRPLRARPGRPGRDRRRARPGPARGRGRARAPRAAQDRPLPDAHVPDHVRAELPADGTLQLAKVSAFVLPRALVTVRREDFDSSRWSGPGTTARSCSSTARRAALRAAGRVVDGHLDAIQQLDDRVEEVEDRCSTSSRGPWTCSAPRTSCAGSMTGVRKVVLPMRERGWTRMIRHDEPRPPARDGGAASGTCATT